MRKNYIDNLRWICILLLFPYHTCRIFSCNDGFYIHGGENAIMSAFVYVCIPWFMPILFAIAGMSTRYALKKRSIYQYAIERVKKLLIPFLSGFILLIPLQTYYANRFQSGFDGSLFTQYKVFFTKITDLSGYDGGMTPGHLWFILYLFVVSIAALLPIVFIKTKNQVNEKLNIWCLLLAGILLFGMNFIGNAGGKSIGKYFTLFMLGYYILADEGVLQKLKEKQKELLLLWIGLEVVYVVLNVKFARNSTLLEILTGWTAILALLGWGQKVLNFRNRFTEYLAKASFPLYIFHQTILVGIGFYILKLRLNEWVSAGFICTGTILLTFAAYEIVKRVPVIRSLFGMKGERNDRSKNKSNMSDGVATIHQ